MPLVRLKLQVHSRHHIRIVICFASSQCASAVGWRTRVSCGGRRRKMQLIILRCPLRDLHTYPIRQSRQTRLCKTRSQELRTQHEVGAQKDSADRKPTKDKSADPDSKKSEVTWISGAADTTLGEIEMPLPTPADDCWSSTSNLQGARHRRANMKASLVVNRFRNRDGLLMFLTATFTC